MDTPLASRPIHLVPELDNDGTRYGWRLVIQFDPDWQDARLDIGFGQGGTFSVHVPDEMVHGMAIPEVTAAPQT